MKSGQDHSLQAQTGVLVVGQLASAWLTPHQARPGPKSRQRGSVEAPPAQNPGGQRKCLPGRPMVAPEPLIGSQRPRALLACTPHNSPSEPTQSHFLPAR